MTEFRSEMSVCVCARETYVWQTQNNSDGATSPNGPLPVYPLSKIEANQFVEAARKRKEVLKKRTKRCINTHITLLAGMSAMRARAFYAPFFSLYLSLFLSLVLQTSVDFLKIASGNNNYDQNAGPSI